MALYGLRHGGASHDTLLQLRSYSQVKERGRWATDASVHRYRKASLAQSETAKMAASHQRLGAMIASNVGRLFLDDQFTQSLPRLLAVSK